MDISYYKYFKYKKKYLNTKMNNINITKISIQNPKQTPWLDWIESGNKKYEGRLNRGRFLSLKIGDRILFYDKKTNKQVQVIVKNILHFSNFEDAFITLGNKLVPIDNITPIQVKKMYNQYFSDNEIAKYGVVAIEVEPIV